MEPELARGVAYVTPATDSNKQLIVTFLSDNAEPLLGTMRSYVQRMGVAHGEEVTATAVEVLQEVAIEALEHADRFHPDGRPMAWLLGIAINILKRKKVANAKRSRRELFIHQLSPEQQEPLSDDELFDQISACTAGPEQDIAAEEQAAMLLALVSREDQQLLRLAFLYGFEREALAEKLGITPAAARVRLHRALKRLRSAWREQYMNNQEGASNE